MADSESPRRESLFENVPQVLFQPASSIDPVDPDLLESSSKESLVEDEQDIHRKRPKRVHPVHTSNTLLVHNNPTTSTVPTLLTNVDFAAMFPSRLPSPSLSPQPSPHIKALPLSPISQSSPPSIDPPRPSITHSSTMRPMDLKEDKKPIKETDPQSIGYLEYFKSELVSVDYDDSHDIKNERVHNFLHVPLQLEKLIWFGFLICVDSFLFVFTFLQIRLCMALVGVVRYILSRGSRRLKTAEKVDLMKGCLFYMACYMMHSLDASMIYHSVRGQAVIKLYVIFNVLEVCDKLCSAFGHDILDSLFSKTATSEFSSPSSLRRLGQFTHFIVALIYVYLHAFVLFYQVMTLNVAVNSFSNSLLTLMMSNQFVEIKGSVFKKFEKENVFQLSCSDIVERFQLIVFMTLITVRNYLELTGGGGWNQFYASLHSITTEWFLNTTEMAYQWSHTVVSSLSLLFSLSVSLLSNLSSSPIETVSSFIQNIPLFIDTLLNSPTFDFMVTLLTPFVVVIGTEILVDGIKHAFITKFNHIRPEAYHHYMATLCRDLAGVCKKTKIAPLPSRVPFSDRSYTVARRVGFLSLPLACLVLRNLFQTMEIMDIQFFPWRSLEGQIDASFSLLDWLIQGHTFQHCYSSMMGLISMDIVYPQARSLLFLHLEQAMIEVKQLVTDATFQQRWIKVSGLALVSFSILLVIFMSLIYIKMRLGLFLHRQASSFVERTSHLPEASRRPSVYVPSDTERRAVLPSELDDKRLDQIDRYTFIKRIV